MIASGASFLRVSNWLAGAVNASSSLARKADSMIAGFSHTHLSGTGVGDLADISVMPTQKEIKKEYFERNEELLSEWAEKQQVPVESLKTNYLINYRSHFSHENEIARPGYYAVQLDDDSIFVELGVTEYVGWHSYTYHQIS